MRVLPKTADEERCSEVLNGAQTLEPVSVADEILTQIGPRAVTLLTTPRTLDGGRTVQPRLSVNDCYVALPEACRKMARVSS